VHNKELKIMGIYAMYSVTFKLDGRENWGIQGEGGARSD
jgi:hypothetical protein